MGKSYVFDVEDAIEYGVNGAILLWNIRHWLEKNRVDDRNFHDGKYWTYASIQSWTELFSFWSYDQIRHVIERLEKDGAIIVGDYNKERRDRTKWYALSDFYCQRRQLQLGKIPIPIGKNPKPLPYSNHTNNKESINRKKEETDVSNSTSSKKKKNEMMKISQLAKWGKCLSILKRLNGFKLPEECFDGIEEVPVTQTLTKIVADLESIEHGDFMRSIQGTSSFMIEPMVPDDLALFLDEWVNVFQSALKAENWPVDKSSIQSVNGTKFLRSYTGHSWLIWCIENAEKIVGMTKWSKEEAKGISEELRYQFADLLGESEDSVSVIESILSVYTRIIPVLENKGYWFQENASHLADKDQIAFEYCQFLKGWSTGAGVGHVKSDSVWKLFVDSIWKEYSVDLTLKRVETRMVIEEKTESFLAEEKKQMDKDIWEAGMEIRKKEIYDQVVFCADKVVGEGEARTNRAMNWWEYTKDRWIEEYGECEWVQFNVNGVIKTGGIIDDEKGIKRLENYGRVG